MQKDKAVEKDKAGGSAEVEVLSGDMGQAPKKSGANGANGANGSGVTQFSTPSKKKAFQPSMHSYLDPDVSRRVSPRKKTSNSDPIPSSSSSSTSSSNPEAAALLRKKMIAE